MKNSFTIIYDWMLDLGLSITQLFCYAIIYSFCAGGIGSFTGSRSYLIRKMGCKSKRTADKALLDLIGLGLIIKIEKYWNGIKFCEYRVDPEHIPACVTDAINVDTGATNVGTSANTTVGDGADYAHNNKEKKQKESISPSIIARDVCPGFSEEFYDLIDTLSTEVQWKSKSETQWRFNLKRLAKNPEIEACEMIRRTIEGGWKGFYALKPEDKAVLYGRCVSTGNGKNANDSTTNVKPKKFGIIASEALVAAALNEFNNNS